MEMESLVCFKLDYFVYKTCGVTWKVPKQVFSKNGLVLVLDGTARYVIDGAEYNVNAGELVFVAPGSTREATTTGMICAAIDFVAPPGAFFLPTVSTFIITDELLRQLREFQFEWIQKTPGREIKCASLFLAVMHTLLYGKEIKDTNYHVDKMKRYIIRHFAENFPLDVLAGHVGLSRVYCGALFRKIQGVTVSEYLNRVRVHESAAMLDEGAHSITEIAYLCGFNDLSYYSNTFKRIMGVSPAKYKSRPLPH